MHENLTAFGGYPPPPPNLHEGLHAWTSLGDCRPPDSGSATIGAGETLSPNFERWGTGGGSKYIFDVLCASNKKYILNIYSMRYFTF